MAPVVLPHSLRYSLPSNLRGREFRGIFCFCETLHTSKNANIPTKLRHDLTHCGSPPPGLACDNKVIRVLLGSEGSFDMTDIVKKKSDKQKSIR